jgi:RNA polymerase sigma factor for flagellar operon FliA
LDEYLSQMATAMALALVSRASQATPGEEVESEAQNPEEHAAASEVSGAIRSAISRLPDSEKTLVERHYFGEATLEEASRELGLSKSWGSRLHARAIEALTRDMKRNRISE